MNIRKGILSGINRQVLIVSAYLSLFFMGLYNPLHNIQNTEFDRSLGAATAVSFL